MASASSSARRKDEINSGTSIGTSAFMREPKEPVSMSAPRDFCADIILSVSSMSVGIKRSAMVIIIASSCTGSLNTDSGASRRSMPSVSSMGEVV